MMRTYFIAVALSALSFASADMKNFTIDPNEVPASTRATWCQAELNTCNTLCSSAPTANDCQVSDLSYHCTCQNGTAPGLEYYTQTIYSFVCQQAFTDCNLQNVGNKTGQDACVTNIRNNCGTLDPTKFQPSSGGDTSSSTSPTSSPTGTGTPSSTSAASGTGSSATTSASHNAAPTAAYLGSGAAVVAAGFFAALL
ncbi:hypothetical protein BR93DRAFT_278008 [Coniochaeta sp. PMI_546]|nr:hypothetical protein BR93DRAFT_278008 [Coniochaeta sp. PMI_546]